MTIDESGSQSRRKRISIVSQVYVPDPAAVGHYMHDLAAGLVEQGWDVTVYTSRGGYDDPSIRYPAREVIDGVHVTRIPFAAFGKQSFLRRILGGLSFVLQSALRICCSFRRADLLVMTTSPPLSGLVAAAAYGFRRIPFCYWVMDFNFEQILKKGGGGPLAFFARRMRTLERFVITRARDVIVLDKYMAAHPFFAERETPPAIIPPWPLMQHLGPIAHEDNPFREKYELNGKTVFMYSGNMGIGHPIETILEAAKRLNSNPKAAFLFVGGGVRMAEVTSAIDRGELQNAVALPFQPIGELKYSLSAADVHFVTMDATGVGVFHPSKVYSAMAVARALVFVGPDESHVTDLLEEVSMGWAVTDGDVDGLEEVLRGVLADNAAEAKTMGANGRQCLEQRYSRATLLKQLTNRIVSALEVA